MARRRFHSVRGFRRTAMVIVLAGAVAAAASFALARSAPPRPTITSAPAPATTSRSATFVFVDPRAGVHYTCSLDTATYATCTSGITYTRLAEGTHIFRVEAVDKTGATSTAASDSWIVDNAPPATTITFPANGASLNANGYGDGCSGRGRVCGTATDRVTVYSVAIAVRQNQTGKYWNGRGFTSSSKVFLGAGMSSRRGSITWFYSLPLPSPDGSYTALIRATDMLGNQTPPGQETTSTFAILTTPPPPPAITAEPSNPTFQTNASFSFIDSQAAVTFQCQLDGAAFSACTAPATYSGLRLGSHTFVVRARDAAGNLSAATKYSWTIQPAPPPAPFTIAGVVPTPLYPGGATGTVPVRITNPNSTPIIVTSLTTSVTGTGATGCQGGWFSVTQASIPTAGITVPAAGSVTLPAQGATAPTLSMLESGTNQDACKGASLTLTFTGSAHT